MSFEIASDPTAPVKVYQNREGTVIMWFVGADRDLTIFHWDQKIPDSGHGFGRGITDEHVIQGGSGTRDGKSGSRREIEAVQHRLHLRMRFRRSAHHALGFPHRSISIWDWMQILVRPLLEVELRKLTLPLPFSLCGAGRYAPFLSERPRREQGGETASVICFTSIIRHGLTTPPVEGRSKTLATLPAL